MKFYAMMLCTGLLLCGTANAHRDYRQNSVGNTDAVVDMPPEVWTQGQNNQQNTFCQHCCTYENRSYSEGAVIKMEGVLLQCVRDKQSMGTNNLIWQIIK